MKKFFSYLCLAAIATTTLVSCSKTDSTENLPTSPVKKVSFSAKSANPDTKTYFGDKTSTGYPTVWTDNQKVSICLNYGSSTAATVTPSGDGKTASFNATLNDDGSNNYVFYAVSPAAGVLSWNSTYSSVNVTFPANQTPTMGSVDEAAHIMAAKSATFTEFPEEDTPVSLTFSHIAAYGKFMLKNFPETVTIQGIDLAADENIVGRIYFYPETGELVDNSASKILSLNVSAISAESNASKVFWFGIKPVDLQGKNLKVTVHTDNGDYIKTITFPSGKGNFQAGKVAAFNIDMNGITPAADKVYTLVTSYDELLPNSEVIIVANDDDFAVGANQQPNNRVAAVVTKGTNTITNPGDAVQAFNLVAGNVSNTVAFQCINGDYANQYIGSASSTANYLRSFATNDDNTSFGVIFEGNVARLVAKGENTRNEIRFNNGDAVFSCYASGQGDVAIYKLEGSGSGSPLVTLITHTVTFTQPSAGGSFTVSVDGNPIASGDAVQEGKTVTLTATASEHYAFSSWTVNGATVSGNSATATFTVGADDVTIEAAFINGYTLDGSQTGGSSDYSTESTITQSDISWKVMANTTLNPWRIGGKKTNSRTIYNTTPISYDINSITVSHGSKSSKMNSVNLTVVVASDANFSNVIYTSSEFTVNANGTVTVTRPDGADWSNCYYKFTYECSANGNNNEYIQFISANFAL